MPTPASRSASGPPISHLALAERADVYLIAPATANTMAKLATGQADNLLLAAALVARCPMVVAPAMNASMYRHAATQANVATLRERGVVVLPPGEGELASHGERGVGRLPEPADLLAACEALLTTNRWAGRRVLVTAGGTREPLDSVRFIGNRSSGRMGVALAARAAARGAHVTLIAANLAVPPPASVRVIEVQTAAELLAACLEEFPAADVLLMAAAVSDFKPATPVDQQAEKGRRGPASGPAGSHARCPRLTPPASAPGSAARGLCRRARAGRHRLWPGQARREGSRCDRGQRRLTRGHRLRV